MTDHEAEVEARGKAFIAEMRALCAKHACLPWDGEYTLNVLVMPTTLEGSAYARKHCVGEHSQDATEVLREFWVERD